ncbi:MAG: type II toxin-antitoxin system VapC family toxin [Spirochaetes bacterium]|nr:type II toxin-antitoxin system VapC family toxin [Spirochaetota bacterium]
MIFADSSYFIALVREKDRWHEDAVKLAGNLNDTLTISDFIISESVTLVGSLEGGKTGKLLYEYFVDNCKIEYMDNKILAKSMKIFLKYDGSISLADATSVELMKKHRIKKIISFDKDFDKIKEIERLY